ncbi:MAG: DUF302 domain-containing protein [Armatimonadota bacterium]
MTQYAMSITLPGTVESIRPRVLDALKAQGFGVLTTIDVQATMREKIGVEIEPYLILGACNPKFAHQALSADPNIGLLLPCNVVLREGQGDVEVSILDPEVMFSVVDAATAKALAALPGEVKARLQAALTALQSG